MDIKVKAMNDDGSVAFEGSLDADQLSFVLSVGVNYLLSEGAGSFLQQTDEQEEQEEDEDPTTRH